MRMKRNAMRNGHDLTPEEVNDAAWVGATCRDGCRFTLDLPGQIQSM